MYLRTTVAVMLVGTVSAVTALAHGYKHKTLEVIHPYTFEKPEPEGNAAIVRMTLRNAARQTERLIGVSSTIAERVEIVVPGTAGGKAPRLEIKAGAEVELKQATAHIRLIGLKKPLVAYDTLPLALTFQHAGRIAIDVLVEETPQNK